MGVQKLNTIYIYNVFDDCVEWADDFFWSWFDYKRSTFDEDIGEKNDFHIFFPSDLDPWTSLFTLVH